MHRLKLYGPVSQTGLRLSQDLALVKLGHAVKSKFIQTPYSL